MGKLWMSSYSGV